MKFDPSHIEKDYKLNLVDSAADRIALQYLITVDEDNFNKAKLTEESAQKG
jgi:hypothetical protein